MFSNKVVSESQSVNFPSVFVMARNVCVIMGHNLFVDPGGGGGLPADELLGLEPKGDLVVGALDGVGTVADVAADFDGEITTD